MIILLQLNHFMLVHMGICNQLAGEEKSTFSRLTLDIFEAGVTVILTVHLLLGSNHIAVTM